MEQCKLNQKSQQLSDKYYLSKYIGSANFIYPDKLWAIKNLESVYLSTTIVHTKMMGISELDKIVGKKDEHMPCKIAEVAETFYNQDKVVRTTSRDLHMLDIHEYCTGLAFLKTIKKPIINPYTSPVLGTFAHCTPFNASSYLKTILDIHSIRFGKHPSMQISTNQSKLILTELERDVLFCICLGINSRKDIAFMLSIIYKKEIYPETTINDAFRRLYQKLDCNSPSQLLAIAEYNNLNLEIPKGFLPTGSYIIG